MGTSWCGARPCICRQRCARSKKLLQHSRVQQDAVLALGVDAWRQQPFTHVDRCCHHMLTHPYAHAGTSPGTGTCNYHRAARSGRITAHAHPSLHGYEQQSSSGSRRRRPSNSSSSSKAGGSSSSSLGSSVRGSDGYGGGGGGLNRSLQWKQQQLRVLEQPACTLCETVTSR